MAFAFLSHVVADLTLGKPALFWLPTTASVRDALRVLKLLAEDVSEISIWECLGGNVTDPQAHSFHGDLTDDERVGSSLHQSDWCCRCIGKVCMQKIICYLASDESLCNPGEALHAPVTTLLADGCPDYTVQHIDPQASLLEALQLIGGGAQNLVVPITGHASNCDRQSRDVVQKHAVTQKSILPLRSHNGQAYCWLTHEDVLRFLLGSIGVFSPLPMMSIEDLGIIETDVRMVKVDSEAVSALEMIKVACFEMAAVAVVDDADDVPGAFNLVGDISCTTLQTCNETAALALATLSVGDFLMYVHDYRNPEDVVVDLMRTRLYAKLGRSKGDHYVQPPVSKGEVNLFLQDLEIWEESSSDGEESGADSPTGPHDLSGKWLPTHLRASRMGNSFKSRSGPIFCNPKSSLVAVLLQALAHREHYVWVTREDGTLMGIVTFSDILTVMLNHVNS